MLVLVLVLLLVLLLLLLLLLVAAVVVVLLLLLLLLLRFIHVAAGHHGPRHVSLQGLRLRALSPRAVPTHVTQFELRRSHLARMCSGATVIDVTVQGDSCGLYMSTDVCAPTHTMCA